jgi:hypothetical protein
MKLQDNLAEEVSMKARSGEDKKRKRQSKDTTFTLDEPSSSSSDEADDLPSVNIPRMKQLPSQQTSSSHHMIAAPTITSTSSSTSNTAIEKLVHSQSSPSIYLSPLSMPGLKDRSTVDLSVYFKGDEPSHAENPSSLSKKGSSSKDHHEKRRNIFLLNLFRQTLWIPKF